MTASQHTQTTRRAYPEGGPWTTGFGPVLTGAAAAFLTFITFSALWLALSAGGSSFIGGNLAWFEFATALGAAAVGGFVTGWLQNGTARSAAFRGFASWGVVLLAGLVVGVPASTAIFTGATNIALQQITTQGGDVAQALGNFNTELWSTFVIFAGGGLLAMFAGSAGARGAALAGTDTHEDEVRHERHEDIVVEDRERETVSAS